MRLDKYMKVSRIIKRRTVANEAASAGRISVNGRIAKPSSEVKPGDEIDILLGGKHFLVRVESVQETVRKEDAAGMYTVLREARDSEDR
jgi:ribosomal 50S subunit-recycling heat shock protein